MVVGGGTKNTPWVRKKLSAQHTIVLTEIFSSKPQTDMNTLLFKTLWSDIFWPPTQSSLVCCRLHVIKKMTEEEKKKKKTSLSLYMYIVLFKSQDIWRAETRLRTPCSCVTVDKRGTKKESHSLLLLTEIYMFYSSSITIKIIKKITELLSDQENKPVRLDKLLIVLLKTKKQEKERCG